MLHYRKTGTGDIDLIVTPADTRRPWRVIYLRAHFIDKTSTSVTKDADLTATVQHDPHNPDTDQPFNAALFTLGAIGLNRDGNYQPPDGTGDILGAGQGLGLAWTNPDDGLIAWGIELAYEHYGQPIPSGRPGEGLEAPP